MAAANISLNTKLVQRKASILRRWAGLVFETYPPDTAIVLKAGGDRFANPVCYAVIHNLEMILDGLFTGKEMETLFPYLREILKIRAVQDFTPSGAVSFMALLKKAMNSETGPGAKSKQLKREMMEFEQEIDVLSAACSDIYLECRHKIGQIKAGEQKKMAANMAGLQERSGRGI